MMKFTVSAPGKIILAGEHAVVYGYRGIASSINLRCYASIIKPNKNNKMVCLHLRNIPFDFEMSENEYKTLLKKVRRSGNFNNDFDPRSMKYQSIVNEFIDDKLSSQSVYDTEFLRGGLFVFVDLYLYLLGEQWRSMEVTVNSEFSYGCGLGSSAAYSTVLATALLVVKEHLPEDVTMTMDQLELISSLAFRGEQIVHGTPSGIDNCISAYGGSLLFKRKLNEVARYAIEVPHIPVLLVDTRVKRCTKTVVNHVRGLMKEDGETFHRYFTSIDSITMDLVSQLSAEIQPNRIEILNQLVENNQTLLDCIGVSHSSIDDVISILKLYGISAKLTGAGWGGCVFAFVEGIVDKVLNTAMHNLRDRGYGVQLTNLSCPGVDVQSLTKPKNINS